MIEAPSFDVKQRVQETLNGRLAGRAPLRVLEAGCGSTSHLDISYPAYYVGIDVSRAQLDRHANLDHRIHGDLETHEFLPDEFDLIICWDVLEHLQRPELALASFERALKPGGLLVIAIPNVLSAKGLVAKFTPFWVHEWFYRYLMGDQSVGTDSFRQFPTYLRMAITPNRLRRYAEAHSLNILEFNLYEGPVQRDLRRRHPWASAILDFFGAISRGLSGARVDLNHSDLIVVLEKPEREKS